MTATEQARTGREIERGFIIDGRYRRADATRAMTMYEGMEIVEVVTLAREDFDALCEAVDLHCEAQIRAFGQHIGRTPSLKRLESALARVREASAQGEG